MKIYLAARKMPNYNPAVGDLRINLADGYPGNISSAVERNSSPLRFLTSYHYYEKYDMGTLFGSPQPALLADSGAFSAESQGVSTSPMWLFSITTRTTSKLNTNSIPPVTTLISVSLLATR